MEEQTFFYEILSKEQFLPAAGQGIIALETRQKDCEDCMQAIHDEDTWQMFLTERSFLRAIGGGCNEAAAVECQNGWTEGICAGQICRGWPPYERKGGDRYTMR